MILLKLPKPGVLPVAVLVLALASCAQVARKPAVGEGAAGQAAREAELARQADWSFTGRVAIDNDGNAGSARLEWVQRGADFNITLSAPVTRQSWRLARSGGRARLEGLEGGVREGSDAEALLLDATGWRIPVDSLDAWVRGSRADATRASVEYGPAGLPSILVESGWTVEYRAWGEGQPPLPARLFARQGNASVRLAIERWSAP